MNSIGRSRLKYPNLSSGIILLVGALGCANLITAAFYANSCMDLLYSSMPILLTAMLCMHHRHPTPLGWRAIAFLLLTPTIIGIIVGLSATYFDIGVKYGWGALIELLIVDIAVFMAIAGILYSTNIEAAP